MQMRLEIVLTTKPRTNPYEEYDDREFTKQLSKPTALAAHSRECSFMGTTVFLSLIHI